MIFRLKKPRTFLSFENKNLDEFERDAAVRAVGDCFAFLGKVYHVAVELVGRNCPAIVLGVGSGVGVAAAAQILVFSLIVLAVPPYFADCTADGAVVQTQAGGVEVMVNILALLAIAGNDGHAGDIAAGGNVGAVVGEDRTRADVSGRSRFFEVAGFDQRLADAAAGIADGQADGFLAAGFEDAVDKFHAVHAVVGSLQTHVNGDLLVFDRRGRGRRLARRCGRRVYLKRDGAIRVFGQLGALFGGVDDVAVELIGRHRPAQILLVGSGVGGLAGAEVELRAGFAAVPPDLAFHGRDLVVGIEHTGLVVVMLYG